MWIHINKGKKEKGKRRKSKRSVNPERRVGEKGERKKLRKLKS
jgi:ubiquitin